MGIKHRIDGVKDDASSQKRNSQRHKRESGGGSI